MTSPTTRAHFENALVGAVAAVVHRVDHAAVHGLEAVAHVGQRAADDDAHRVVEVRRAASRAAGRPARSCRGRASSVGRVLVVSHRLSSFVGSSCRSSRDAARRALRCRGSARPWRCCWMKLRRDSTSSPIRVEKISSAAAASSRVTCSSVRVVGVHRGLPQLLVVHLAETLVALDAVLLRDPLAARRAPSASSASRSRSV